jgi:phosphoglycolate phosphatase
MNFPKAVLFDWDNTLADTLEVCLEATNATMAHFGEDLWTLERLLASPHLSVRDSFHERFKDRALEAMEVYHGAFADMHLSRLKVLPYAHDLIRFLYDSNVFISIISNKTGSFLRSELEFLGWNMYFTSIVGSHDYDFDKPSPVPVIETLRKGNLTPGQDVWFVGDSSVDIQCARNAGCLPVFVGKELHESHHGDDIVWAQNCQGVLSLLLKAENAS